MRTATLVGLLLGGAAARLSAQAAALLTGSVHAADSTPLAQARLRVAGTALAVVSGADGTFRLAGVPVGKQLVDVRLLGYEPATVPIELRGDSLHVRVTLVALPQEIAGIEVKAEIPVALRGFEERRARGPGVFFTGDEIVRLQPRQLTDVLRRAPGIQVRPVSGAYGENLAVMSRGSRCPMMFYVNGAPFPLPNDIPIDHYVAVEEVVALELYTPSEIPPQYNSSMYNARCGLVGVWTRGGR